jgi:uncharacterized protein YjbI with pentapeptide repeats
MVYSVGPSPNVDSGRHCSNDILTEEPIVRRSERQRPKTAIVLTVETCDSRLLLSAVPMSVAAEAGRGVHVAVEMTINGQKVDIKPRAMLESKNLSNAQLSGVNLRGANLSRANLFSVNLSGANLDPSPTPLPKQVTNLRRADLNGAANLSDARLDFAELVGANLTGANLTGAKLRDADLREAVLGYVNLTGASLHGASLNSAYLKFADFSGAQLHGANLSGAILTDAVNLTQAQADSTLSNSKTMWPSYIKPPKR